jgi:hypothetical protein
MRLRKEGQKMKENHDRDKIRKREWRKQKETQEAKMIIRELEKTKRKKKQ